MKWTVKKDNGAFKPKVSMAATKGDRMIAELASAFGVCQNQILQLEEAAVGWRGSAWIARVLLRDNNFVG